MKDNIELSVCVPVYYGAKTIEKLVEHVCEELEGKCRFEIVLVNDGSKDDSEKVCTRIAEARENVKFVALRKNYGENNAVMCAFHYAEGEYAVHIDDDFQNPPSEILKLLDEAKKGYDVVYSKYHEKKHSLYRNLGSKFHNMVADFLLDKPKGLYLSTFRIVKKEVYKEIIKYTGPFPYIDGLILRVTDNIGSIYVEHSEREEGKSTYTLSKLISVWLNMFINFSIKPLRMFTLFGVLLALTGFIIALWTVLEKYFLTPDMPIGYASVIFSILILSGIQIIFLGLIGEYLGKNYLDQNGTPQWVVKKVVKKS